LLKVARAAFAAHGLAGARVDDIARTASVTKQLVYYYFNSKEQLFACVLDESAEENIAALLALDFDHLTPREALRAALNQAFDHYRDDSALGPRWVATTRTAAPPTATSSTPWRRPWWPSWSTFCSAAIFALAWTHACA